MLQYNFIMRPADAGMVKILLSLCDNAANSCKVGIEPDNGGRLVKLIIRQFDAISWAESSVQEQKPDS